MSYKFSTNITVTEMERMLAYAKSKETEVIGVHFSKDAIMTIMHLSEAHPDSWDNIKDHVDITDWESA